MHALTLMVLLGAPRLGYRLYRGRPRRASDDPALQRVVLVGAGDAADALHPRRQPPMPATGLRIVGLLALARPPGRAAHAQLADPGHRRPGGALLAGLRRRRRLPSALVVTEPDFLGAPLAALIARPKRRAFRCAARRVPPR